MKNKFTKIVIFSFMISLSAFSCQKSQVQTDNISQLKTISASEISRLKNGETVQFSAILKRKETNCIEIFNEDEFKKYNGDSKWAVFSRFTSDANSTSFEEGKKVLVKGKITFVKDVSDTSKTCGIVTGQIFEISEIKNF